MKIRHAIVALTILLVPGAAWAGGNQLRESDWLGAIEEARVPVEVFDMKSTSLTPGPREGLEIQGGYTRFTGDLGDVVDDGGNWALRALFNLDSRVGAEVAYYGANSTIEGAEARAVSSSFESLARFHFLTSDKGIQPFVGAGLAWFRLVATGDEELLPMDDGGRESTLDALTIPLAIGVAFFPRKNLSLGLRGGYRIPTNALNSRFPSGESYNISLTLGVVQ